MLYTAVLVLGFGGGVAAPATPVAPAAPVKLPGGIWRITGNGFVGDLVIRLAANGKVEGTIYGQPIAGTFDAATKKLVFKRMKNPADTAGVQLWTGTLIRIPDTDRPHFRLEGTYRSIAGPQWGKADTDYTWKSETRMPLD
jgi:hypothetical protein